MKLTFLVDNKTESVETRAEWGLSILIEAEGHTYLYDVGTSSMFAENADKMGVKLENVEAVMISHGHFDHTGGMEAFCERNGSCPIYLHKEGLIKSYETEKDALADKDSIGVPWTDEFTKGLEGRLALTEGVTAIGENVTLVGNIPVPAGYRFSETFYRLVDGATAPDPMRHEQFVAVVEDDELHILSGCSHNGVLNTIACAKSMFPDKRVVSYTGGFHTYMYDRKQAREFGLELKKQGIRDVVPMHCTGLKTIAVLSEVLGNGCHLMTAGDKLEL